jgi:hypothetical protein
MSKKFIQQLVREDLLSRIREAGKNSEEKPVPSGKKDPENEYPKDNSKRDKPSEDKDFEDLNAGEKKKVKTLTTKIKNSTQGSNRILKLSQVMDASGAMCGDHKCNADSASDRSITAKEISGKPDADGKVRHPKLSKVTAMGKVVDNPQAYNE